MIPKCFCLTIAENPWRNEAVVKRFERAGLDVEMYFGVHGQTIGIQPTMTVWDAEAHNTFRNNPGKVSITISKLLLWQHILDVGCDEALIFENDVMFVPNFKEQFEESYSSLPVDWDVAHVGSCCTEGKPTEVINGRISRIKYPLCCHAILWTREAIEKAIELFKRASWGSNSDIILEKAVYPQLNHYTFTPPLAFQDNTPSEAAKTENWQDIPGWFDWHRIYDEQLTGFGFDPATVVEVGSWLGRSTAYMAEEIKRRLKTNVKFYTVDTWKGSSNESDMQATLAAHNGDIYSAWESNMYRCGVRHYVAPIRKTSVEAAAEFPDGSLDFVFIDGDHSFESVYADLKAWLPKVHYHRTMAGHDCDRESVRRALDTVIPGKWRQWERCWIVDHVGV